jgi:thioesterase domain-containing protein/acyl carrier protein
MRKDESLCVRDLTENDSRDPVGQAARSPGQSVTRSDLWEDVPDKTIDSDFHRDNSGEIPEENTLPRLAVTEEKILQIWKDVLDLATIAPDDDFFQSGGNSLAAIHLLVRIQREYHTSLPADTVYRYPTIRQQASLITDTTGRLTPYHRLIVPIRNAGTLPPLFCVHPIDGWIGQYKILASFLREDLPVYGIRAQGWEADEVRFSSLEEAAPEYIRAIKTVQEKGPYYLAGFSGGAPYVFELAVQLKKSGETVGFVGLIDQSAPVPEIQAYKTVMNLFHQSGEPKKVSPLLYTSFRSLKEWSGSYRNSRIYALVIWCIRTGSGIINRIAGWRSGTPSASEGINAPDMENNISSVFPEKQRPLVRSLLRNIMNYSPPEYTGPVTLFSTGPDLTFFPGDPTRGWGRYVKGNFSVISVPGNHDTLFENRNCILLGEKIGQSIGVTDGNQ